MKVGLMWYTAPSECGNFFEMVRGDMHAQELPQCKPLGLGSKSAHRGEQPHRRPQRPKVVMAQ